MLNGLIWLCMEWNDEVYVNEPSGYIQAWEFLDHQNSFKFLGVCSDNLDLRILLQNNYCLFVCAF
jgi:hypothetical protein